MVYSRPQIIIEIPTGDKLLDQSKANAQFARDRPHHIVRGHTESVVPQDVKIVIFPLNSRQPVCLVSSSLKNFPIIAVRLFSSVYL